MSNSILNTGGILRLAATNDFVGPSQACILPLQKKSETREPMQVKIREKKERLVKDVDKKEALSNDEALKRKILVSLSDCLACSGCITTAETVFLQSQTIDELFEGLRKSTISVITVSPQSVCSLAVHYGVSNKEMAMRISTFFKSKGATYIVDSSFARMLSHKLVANELTERLEKKGPLPLLSSVCPGFVLYSEKTGEEDLLPLLSKVRSPQALSGALVKDYLAKKMNVNATEIFHATVMPCSDKKLEASRSDFVAPGTQIKEVDCVVSTIELGAELRNVSTLVSELDESASLDWLSRFEHGLLIGQGEPTTSGGLTEYLCRELEEYLARRSSISTGFYKTKSIRDDLIHQSYFSILNEDPIFTFIKAYGFRNLQDMVRKLKRQQFGESVFFIEIMACPSGCGGGGGQIRPEKESTVERKNLTKKVQAEYESIRLEEPDKSILLDEVESVMGEWKKLNPQVAHLFYTDFHSVPKNLNINDW